MEHEVIFTIREAFNLAVFLLFWLAFYRIIRDDKNDLQWWHLFSTTSADGKVYFDLDKVGQIVGLVFSTWVIVWLAYRDKLTESWIGGAFFASWLVYTSGMGAFSKWARSFVSARYGRENGKKENGMREGERPEGERK